MSDDNQRGNDGGLEFLLSKRKSPPEVESEPELLIGRTLADRYRIERVIGRGGMGVIYLARQLVVDRKVVVKVLSRRWSEDRVARIRFEREAHGLSRLQHPNIVTLHDFGHDQGLPYIVMEFVEGATLSDVMRRKRYLRVREFMPIAVQILSAIGEAHSAGLVHRDIKPDNIMICPRRGSDDVVKVLDFGLARVMSHQVEITKHNLMGTALYLSPEQIMGKRVDQRADVYSLGVLFYLLLSGKRPFDSTNDANLLFLHVKDPPRSLRQVLPQDHDVPTEIIHLVHRCLEKDPDRRPWDATEMLHILQQQISTSNLVLPSPETDSGRVPELSELTGENSPILLETPKVTPPVVTPLPGATLGAMQNETPVSPVPQVVARPQSDQFETLSPPRAAMNSGEWQAPSTHQVATGAVADGQHPVRSATIVGSMYVPAPRTVGDFEWAAARRRWSPASVLAVVLFIVVILGAGAIVAPLLMEGVDRSSRVQAVLVQAEGLLTEEKYGEVEYLLDSVEHDAAEHPELLFRIATLRDRASIGRMIIEGRQREDAGDAPGAIVIYQQVLTRDPQHAGARQRLVQLGARKAPESPNSNKIEMKFTEDDDRAVKGVIPKEVPPKKP